MTLQKIIAKAPTNWSCFETGNFCNFDHFRIIVCKLQNKVSEDIGTELFSEHKKSSANTGNNSSILINNNSALASSQKNEPETLLNLVFLAE